MNTRPNILILMADQLRRQALSCYGDPNIQTPHLDRLARQGTRFTNACSSFPVCVPFRFTFMTGQSAHSRGMPSIGYRMSPAERTLADEWNDAGYHTVYIGKWHLYGGGHGILPDYDNLTTNRIPVPRAHQGRWQKWFGFELCNAHFNTCTFEDDDPTPRNLGKYQTDGLFDIAIEYVGKQRDAEKPFACVLSVEPPHPPYDAPEELRDKWLQTELIEDPNFMVPDPSLDRYTGTSNLLDPSRKAEALRTEKLYYAMVENFDQNVGRMLDFLESSGLRQNTIVVVLADHGHCGFRHCWQQKTMPFEESIGIPLIISDPHHSESAGQTVESVLGTEDLYPTLLGLTGLSPRSGSGQNFSGCITGQPLPPPRDGILIENTYIIRPDLPRFDKGWRGIRTQRYKYTLEGGIKGGAEPWQLYDLEQDPYELRNLVQDPAHQELAAQLHQQLLNLLKTSGDDFPVAPSFHYPSQHIPQL